jgi:GH15 family glucan-1,4-alpha-glucosidase
VLDALHAARDAGLSPHPAEVTVNEALLKPIERCWAQPDNGIWEVRGPRRHFVHSKLMTWVAVDRAIRAVDPDRSDGSVALLRDLRRTIRADIAERGFCETRRAFTQSYGSTRLDASLLLMPRYGFLPWTDPRIAGTVEAIQRDLTRDGLVMPSATRDPTLDGCKATKARSFHVPSGSPMPSTASAGPTRPSNSSTGCFRSATRAAQ